jgi:hypothetical protein
MKVHLISGENGLPWQQEMISKTNIYLNLEKTLFEHFLLICFKTALSSWSQTSDKKTRHQHHSDPFKQNYSILNCSWSNVVLFL